jgi:hypothetical protein
MNITPNLHTTASTGDVGQPATRRLSVCSHGRVQVGGDDFDVVSQGSAQGFGDDAGAAGDL